MKKLFIIALFLLSAGLVMAITATDTITPTSTETAALTPGITGTPTTQTKVFAFPNPVKNTNTVNFSYPVDSISGQTAVMAVINIHAADGAYAGSAYDNDPSGYTAVDITKYARGTYIYQVIVTYSGGTKKKLPLSKFAVIK